MTKIMLVEDDKSLREIYGVRLLAEGYDIVSAGDGEEALAMAIKERPALIITDVMMPRISGFDMLDILRSTTETRNIKVIMMTALSSEDQRRHGEQLGADRYLVKSQVGIEDVVRVVHEVLDDTPPPIPAPAAPAPAATAPAAQVPQPAATPRPTVQTAPAATPVAPPRPTAPLAPPRPVSPATPAAQPASAVHGPAPIAPVKSTTPPAPSTRQRIIQPINDPTTKVDINSLLDKELAREAGVDINNRPPIATAQQERAAIQAQLQQVAPPAPMAPVPPSAPPTPVPPPTAPITPPTAPIQPRPPVQPPTRPATPPPPAPAPRPDSQTPGTTV